MKRLWIWLTVALLALVPPAWAGQAGTVAAAGQGIVEARADEARVAFFITGTGPTLRAAVADGNARARRIEAEIGKLGLKGVRVETDDVSAGNNPDRGLISRKRDYRVSIGGVAVVTDMAALLPVVYLLSDLSVERIDQVRLRMDDDAPELAEAAAKAVTNARLKAAGMARALGKKLGPVVKVQERSLERELLVQPMAMMEMDGPVGRLPGAGAVPNTVTVRVQVGATFRLASP